MASVLNLLFSIFALFAVAHGSPIEQQLDQRGHSALICAIVTGIIKEVKNDAKVTSHCASFLKKPTATVTRTGLTTSTILSTRTVAATVTVPITTILRQDVTVTIPTVSLYTTTLTRTFDTVFVTDPVVIVEEVVTTTSTFCPISTTLKFAKRDTDGYVTADPLVWAQKRSLEARATKKSGVEIIKSLQSKVASTVCGCLSIPTPTTTITSLLTSRATSWTTTTAFQSVTNTITVPTVVPTTTTRTNVIVVPGYLTIPPDTITYQLDEPTITITSTATTVMTCSFIMLPPRAAGLLAGSAAKVHARSDSRGAKPVRFSDRGSAFKLDAEGHLLDENNLIAIAEAVPSNGAAAVGFQALGQANNESMLVCDSDEGNLECNVGEQANRLKVCLPKEEKYPAMYIAGENYDGDCFEGGLEVELQEL